MLMLVKCLNCVHPQLLLEMGSVMLARNDRYSNTTKSLWQWGTCVYMSSLNLWSAPQDEHTYISLGYASLSDPLETSALYYHWPRLLLYYYRMTQLQNPPSQPFEFISNQSCIYLYMPLWNWHTRPSYQMENYNFYIKGPHQVAPP